MPQKTAIRRKMRKYTFNKVNQYDESSIFIMISLILGICIGSVIANMLAPDKIYELSNSISAIFTGFNPTRFVRADVFRESLLKYSKSVGLIWILGFVWAGGLISVVIIGVKGAGVGFLTSLLVLKYGYIGLWYAIGVYIPQNIILIFLCCLLAQHSVTQLISRIGKKVNRPSRGRQKTEQTLSEKFVLLLISMFVVLIVSFYEAYICPEITAFIL